MLRVTKTILTPILPKTLVHSGQVGPTVNVILSTADRHVSFITLRLTTVHAGCLAVCVAKIERTLRAE